VACWCSTTLNSWKLTSGSKLAEHHIALGHISSIKIDVLRCCAQKGCVEVSCRVRSGYACFLSPKNWISWKSNLGGVGRCVFFVRMTHHLFVACIFQFYVGVWICKKKIAHKGDVRVRSRLRFLSVKIRKPNSFVSCITQFPCNCYLDTSRSIFSVW